MDAWNDAPPVSDELFVGPQSSSHSRLELPNVAFVLAIVVRAGSFEQQSSETHSASTCCIIVQCSAVPANPSASVSCSVIPLSARYCCQHGVMSPLQTGSPKSPT
eukprot:1626149-Rhodomonas_salina.1